MPNLTTDSLKYHSEIKEHLIQEFELGWSPLWCYCEMTQLFDYAYSVTFLVKESLRNRKLVYRRWINNLNNEAQLGIYDLDNIRLEEKELDFSLNDAFEIQELMKRGLETDDKGMIVLDGYDKQFVDFKLDKKLNWNLDEEMNESLVLLINKIRKLKSAQL